LGRGQSLLSSLKKRQKLPEKEVVFMLENALKNALRRGEELERSLETSVILNFSGNNVVEVPEGAKVLDIQLPDVESPSNFREIRQSIIWLIESIEKGGKDVVLGNFIIVLPKDELLTACLVACFTGFNRMQPLVAKVEETKEGLRIIGAIELTRLAVEGASIRNEILHEYLRLPPTLIRVLNNY